MQKSGEWTQPERQDAMRAYLALVFAALALSPSVPVEASSLAVRLAGLLPRGESRLWEENIDTFDIGLDDFVSGCGGVEFAYDLNEFFDLAVGVDGCTSGGVESRYRDFVREDGTEIEQTLRLTVVPLTFGVRFLPLGKFRSVIPYVAGGFGLYPYEYREEGEFIDFETFDIFGDVFRDRGLGTGFYGAGGMEFGLSRTFLLFGELRRHFVRSEHEDDFEGFGDFDLDATQVNFGFAVRF